MKFVSQFLLFSITFIIVMGLAELFIQNSYVANTSPNDFYKDIGRGRRRDLSFIYFNEGFRVGKFNQHRYLGKGTSIIREDNTFRIAFLGDSYVESFQIFERHYFGEIAKNKLISRSSRLNYECLNFGRSGFDLANIYAYDNTLVKKFKPNISFYFISEDDLHISDQDPLLPKTSVENDELITSFDFDMSDLLIYEKTKLLIQNSTILNMMNNCRRKAKQASISSILLGKVHNWIFKEENIFDKGRKESNNNLDIVSKKIIESLDPDRVVIVNRDSEKLPVYFVDLIRKNGLHYIDLSELLQNMKLKGEDPNYWNVTNKTGHWNPKAHKIIGERLAEEIELFMLDKKLNP